MSKIRISIGKRWPNSRVPWHKRGSRGGKPIDTLYFKDEEGRFKTKSINKIQKLIEKSKIVKRKICYCGNCGIRLLAELKKSDEFVICPACDSILTLEWIK